MKRHVNIPIFIPHLGCPNQCVFCNQRTISGVEEPNIDNIQYEIETALATIDEGTTAEIAFFGGSFTGIDKELMISLLEIANQYVSEGNVQSIRCSTRPDYINEEILSILKRYNVKTIELGLQSHDDTVLTLSKRGHNSQDEKAACKLIVESGFDLVGQMMIGLPGSTQESEIETAKFIISSGAKGARIYPTVVFKETELAEMTDSGLYAPIELEDAIKRSAAVLEHFIENSIKVIRIGLCASDNLFDENKYYKGPNHPALGELIEGELYYNRMDKYLSDINILSGGLPTVFVASGALSKAIGQHKINKKRLIEKFDLSDIYFKEDPALSIYEIKIEEGKRKCI